MSSAISHTDLLMEMLSIPATSRNEKDRADFLERFMQRQGFKVTRIHHNLLVGDPDLESVGPKILLN